MFTPNDLEKTQDIPNEADAVCQGPAVHTVGLVLEDDLFHISSQQDRQNLGEQCSLCRRETTDANSSCPGGSLAVEQ